METNQTHTVKISPAYTTIEGPTHQSCSCGWYTIASSDNPAQAREIAQHEAMINGGDLGELAKISREYNTLATKRFNSIIDAKRNGATWQQIGDMTGTSRQAAQERYGKYCS